MAATFTPIFNRTNKSNKNGLYPIHVRVTLDRQTRYFNPGLPKIRKEHWLTKPKSNKWIKDSHPQHFEINKALSIELQELETYYNRLLTARIPVTFAKLKDFYARKGNKESFHIYVQHFLNTHRFKSPNTKKKYKTFQKHLYAFSNLCFHHLDEKVLVDFKDWLVDRNYVGSTIHKYLTPFKKIVKTALRKHYLMRDPFVDVVLDIPMHETKRIALTTDEVRSLVNLKFKGENEYLKRHRDVFVFMCSTGLYHKDAVQLTKECIKKTKEGIVLDGTRNKNGLQYLIPLFKVKTGERIFLKYLKEDKSAIFPFVTDQAFNRALKEIAGLAKIEKKITNKVARHTFTDLMISNGYPSQYVSKMLGHTQMTTVQVYYRINAEHMSINLKDFTSLDF